MVGVVESGGVADRAGLRPGDRLLAIEGAVPPPFALPTGCRFHPRCVFADAACKATDPSLRRIGDAHQVACLRAPVETIVDAVA